MTDHTERAKSWLVDNNTALCNYALMGRADFPSLLAQLLSQVERKTIERCAKVAENENLLSGSIGPLMNVGWSCAQTAIASSIRSLGGK